MEQHRIICAILPKCGFNWPSSFSRSPVCKNQLISFSFLGPNSVLTAKVLRTLNVGVPFSQSQTPSSANKSFLNVHIWSREEIVRFQLASNMKNLEKLNINLATEGWRRYKTSHTNMQSRLQISLGPNARTEVAWRLSKRKLKRPGVQP